MEPESKIVKMGDLKGEVSKFEKGKMVIDEAKGRDDFEFTFNCAALPASPVSADVVFIDWRMKQTFPIVSSGEIQETESPPEVTTTTPVQVTPAEIVASRDEDVNERPRASISLWELMNAEKELDLSISTAMSSDVDEIESSLAAAAQPSFSRRSKSKRWSKRWSFRGLFGKGASVHEEVGGEPSAALNGGVGK